MGSKGHAVVDVINDALQAWAGTKARAIEYIYKGHNMLTEHYSMMKADVECAGKESLKAYYIECSGVARAMLVA